MSGSSSANNNILGINSANAPSKSNNSDTDILRQTPAQSALNPVADPTIPSLVAPPGLKGSRTTSPEVAAPNMSHQRSATALPSLVDPPGLLTLSDIAGASHLPLPAATAPTSHRRSATGIVGSSRGSRHIRNFSLGQFHGDELSEVLGNLTTAMPPPVQATPEGVSVRMASQGKQQELMLPSFLTEGVTSNQAVKKEEVRKPPVQPFVVGNQLRGSSSTFVPAVLTDNSPLPMAAAPQQQLIQQQIAQQQLIQAQQDQIEALKAQLQSQQQQQNPQQQQNQQMNQISQQQIQVQQMNQQQPPAVVRIPSKNSSLSEGGGSTPPNASPGISGPTVPPHPAQNNMATNPSHNIVGRIPANKHDNRKLFVGGLVSRINKLVFGLPNTLSQCDKVTYHCFLPHSQMRLQMSHSYVSLNNMDQW